jgi:hypothetical protein
VPLSAAQLVVYGTERSEGLGAGLVGDRDLDGDGLADLLVAAAGASSSAGEVYLYSAGPSMTGSLTDADADATLVGESANDGAGNVVATGDLDGDGLYDLMIGASQLDTTTSTNTGGAYVLLHTPSGTESLSGADGRFVGDLDRIYAGAAIAYAGDVDGDGLGDLLVGGTYAGPSEEGMAWVVPGPASGDTTLTAAAIVAITGAAALDGFGTAFSAPGDVDGDGLAEFAVGASGESTYGSDAGAVYQFRGALSGSVGATDAYAIWYGEQPSDTAGTALATGDIDGDGTLELVIGAPGRDVVNASDGEAYLLAW